MSNRTFSMLLILMSFFLTACSVTTTPDRVTTVTVRKQTTMATGDQAGVPGKDISPVAGNLAKYMDSQDKSKLSHALDSPLGKSTKWTNQRTSISYVVVPTQKITYNENPYCRKYTVTAILQGKTQETSGTACVGADSNWEVVG